MKNKLWRSASLQRVKQCIRNSTGPNIDEGQRYEKCYDYILIKLSDEPVKKLASFDFCVKELSNISEIRYGLRFIRV